MTFKKIIKISIGVVIFFTLPSLLFFGFVYFKYNEDLPSGMQGDQADSLAYKMLNALDHQAFKNTDYIEWTFKRRRHYKWNKTDYNCDVLWKDYKVNINLTDPSLNKAYVHGFVVEGEVGAGLIKKAVKYFENDSFWLVAPYNVFDEGVERRLVNGNDLLVTYNESNSSKQNSYLWKLDKEGKPNAVKMWTSLLPIDGLEASSTDWIVTETGAQLPTNHKFIFGNLGIDNIKTKL